MSVYRLDVKLAQKIVQRTMDIIDCNINIMDAKGRIIASGDADRIGEIHDGALLALSQGRIVDIHDAVTHSLHGVRPGINLPLRLDGQIIGVIGLTGEPTSLKEFGKLVCMAAEMMLEQARLSELLAQDSRLKEELILDLIHSNGISTNSREWANRLSIDLSIPRIACIIEIDSDQLGLENTNVELQNLQQLLKTPRKNDLVAVLSLTELVILKSALNHYGRWDIKDHIKQLEQLITHINKNTRLHVRIAIGHYFPKENNNIFLSFHTAKTTLQIGKSRLPNQQIYNYQDLVLPVLLDQLKDGWQKQELERPLKKLYLMDNNGLLIKTLSSWFEHNMQTITTAKALYIHRNTLEYRLNKICELTGLNLNKTDDLFLLYLALNVIG
ncbi:CdaR family transcriptional regulator [Lonepinella koalarum]|uniref:CdaR family transcriptional regulator n=1 Tax=Lonepinella koalarum TaxID=53417 RepID=A0A4R1KXA2_9PAST|nr:CdaR family transcriptional regulator [Lonepinella koalarum]MDH2927729.1 transcriptional regulator [Lonepinella koalarum]TCK69924.1 CdaR family transcriptional regulator [Lonepinella koalarum]TFJ90472.1 CdaR family transcriptional regulator [Lonepinella koalarum]TYG35168.1 CdaR family transcriptional regulator [Lonepinella koalarum]